MKIMKRKNKSYNTDRFGQPEIRVFHKKATGNKSPGYLLKYGCCNKKLEKYYDEIELEINSVNGKIKDWKEILLPLLQIKS